MKRILIYFSGLVLASLLCIFPTKTASAMASAPYLNLTVIKTVSGTDGNFNFSISGYSGGLIQFFNQNFSISTQQGEGSYYVSTSSGYNDTYYITEDVQDGWQFAGASCVSSNPNISVLPLANGVKLITQPYSNVTCSFVNSKNSVQTPVLIVPGIMGTEILNGGELLWADVNKLLYTKDDLFMDPLASFDNSSNLTLGGVITKKPKFDYTQSLKDEFAKYGYTDGTGLFLFPYDWRRDLSYIASQDDPNDPIVSLKKQIDQILIFSGSPKLDVIAHSQGGLVVKRLLFDHPEYKDKIGKLVFVGVPNLGAPKAAKVLLYGDSMGVEFAGLGLDPDEVRKISQNMPSIYELLPSPEYFSHTLGYLGLGEVVSSSLDVLHISTLNNASTTQYLTGQNLNKNLIERAEGFHAADFDNMDFSGGSMKVYNIVGCQTGTIGKIVLKPNGYNQILETPGDGTVPVFSANNIPGAVNFFALESSHGSMMTQEGIKEQILNLIAGTNLSTKGKITPYVSECKFEGLEVAAHSPVEMHIYNEYKNHVGPTSDGGFDYEIPGVGYDILGHEKFAYLPSGGNYTVKLVATSQGKFSFDSSYINDGQMLNATRYDSIPIMVNSTATISFNSQNNQSLNLDTNGDGDVDQVIPPTAILDQYQSLDAAPPVSTSTLSGLMGDSGFYRSDVKVSLSSLDPVIPGLESQTSGLYRIYYKLDDSSTTSPYSVYDQPFAVSAEGLHSLSFFAADKAGNNETPQTLYFTIDKTPPELVMRFDPSVMDLAFAATDASPAVLTSTSTVKNLKTFPKPKVKLTDRDSIITAIDSAGNTTVLTFKDRDRKQASRAEIKSLSYNSQPANIGKAALSFAWTVNRKQDLSGLVQSVSSKKDFNILAVYSLNRTFISGRDQSGRISQSFAGLKLLRVFTSQGDIGWGIE